MNEIIIWINGRFVDPPYAAVSALDRGLLLGDGVFETILAIGWRVISLDWHLERLRSSTRALGFDVPLDDEALVAGIAAALQAGNFPESYIRVTVTSGIGLGFEPSGTLEPMVIIAVKEHNQAQLLGAKLAVSNIRRNETSPLSQIKSLNYMDSLLARMEAKRVGADEALMLNTRGSVACAAAANVFAVRKGVVLTPPVPAGALPGITRRAALSICDTGQIERIEQEVSLTELEEADEVFLTNCLIGIRPVVSIDGKPVGSGMPGPVTERILEAYLSQILGKPVED